MSASAATTKPTAEPAGSLRQRGLGVWLYAVTDGAGWNTSGLPSGVADEPVRRIDASGLTAVVGTVDLLEFGEEALRRKLEDLDWLATTARAHDRVVNTLARYAVTVPVGFATVFSDDDNVRALLDARRVELTAAIRRLAGRTEWGVKAYAEPAAAARAGQIEAAGDDASGAAGGAGTAFLLRKRAQLAERQSAAKVSAERADRIHAHLSRFCVGSRRYAPQDPALTGRHDRMLLNGAYLVDDAGFHAFRSAVSAINSDPRTEGVRIELTGPWPSYSFTAEGLARG